MTGELVIAPVSVSSQAEYNKQYVLWAGPVSVEKILKKSEPLLCDFTDADGRPIPQLRKRCGRKNWTIPSGMKWRHGNTKAAVKRRNNADQTKDPVKWELLNPKNIKMGSDYLRLRFQLM